MDQEPSQIGASPKVFGNPNKIHAQNTLSQPAQTPMQIVSPRIIAPNTNPEKIALGRKRPRGLPMADVIPERKH
jgi:hypothetical protein